MEEIKRHLRDINLSMLTNTYDIGFDVSRRQSKFQFLKKNYKLIKYTTNLGGILTGSRALSCYTINGRKLLDRTSGDFDFLITKEMAFKICDHFHFNYNLTDKIIRIEKERWTSKDSYSFGETRFGSVDVDLIIVDELPDYKEEGNVKISHLSSIINSKFKMCDNDTKHKNDLRFIIMRFNTINFDFLIKKI